jgi:hypothetical protein
VTSKYSFSIEYNPNEDIGGLGSGDASNMKPCEGQHNPIGIYRSSYIMGPATAGFVHDR